MEFDSRDFRRAMGCFATGITIVSTLAPGGARIGLTVNSFSSVSLDPPLVSFCLARSASRYADFMATDNYAVNIVGAAQQAFSSKFARTGEGDWGDLPMETWSTGAPILPGAIANIECTVHDRFDAGDHVIMLGRVLRLRTAPDVPPLLYYQGAYRLLAPSE